MSVTIKHWNWKKSSIDLQAMKHARLLFQIQAQITNVLFFNAKKLNYTREMAKILFFKWSTLETLNC